MPIIENSDNWEFVTAHAVDFSTGAAQVEGVNAAGSEQAMFYGVTAGKKLYAGSGHGVATITEVDVNEEKHSFAFRQKGQLSYVEFDGEEVKLKENTTTLPPEIGIFGALRRGSAGFFYTFNGKKYSWKFIKNGKFVHNLIPALDPTGTPCMYDLVSQQPYSNAGAGQFIAGVDTVAQLTILLRNLPSTGGTLTLSLPAEANTPEVAEALQACHGTKGWTLTVHEYRPAEAATYSLRRVREVVWCSHSPCEHGSYVDNFGTRWQIDRCAAIFGPHGQDPTAYGYTPFDSVEQAAEQWELTPYQDPETEEEQ